jgi:hypothetical protein
MHLSECWAGTQSARRGSRARPGSRTSPHSSRGPLPDASEAAQFRNVQRLK